MHDEQAPGLDRRALLRRMAAGGAVVWATPMLHSVASAQAVASCGTTPRTLDWDTLPLGPFSSTVVGGVTVSVASAPAPGTTVAAGNPFVDNQTTGGVNGNHLHFEMVSNALGRQQAITFTFSAPVTNLVIPVYDIDGAINFFFSSYLDQVIVNTTGHTSFVPAGSNVIGTGTSADPYRNSVTDLSVQAASNDGNLVLRHPGPISSFDLTYRNGDQFGGFFPQQWIDVGDITFVC